jgi:hypothetical protein
MKPMKDPTVWADREPIRITPLNTTPTEWAEMYPDEVPAMLLFSRENIDKILDTIPRLARCCYTGQSILAYCPNPTFDWAEVNSWPDETDVDIFVYNKAGLASVTQAFIDKGWEPASPIDEFKAERIRFWEAPRKFNLQTVALSKPDMPIVNLTWFDEASNVVACVQRFDMDYLMVAMDVHTGTFIDLRGADHRIANVNRLNAKFDIDDVDVMFWARQFDRLPKGYARGIDTRLVARTYLAWLEESLERGDRGASSKTRMYADRKMESSIKVTVEQAEAMYHLFRREDSTWEAMRIALEERHQTITEWLASVTDD